MNHFERIENLKVGQLYTYKGITFQKRRNSLDSDFSCCSQCVFNKIITLGKGVLCEKPCPRCVGMLYFKRINFK